MSIIISDKIRVGISACNIGARVRWNRAGWDRIKPLEREAEAFIWVPVCPEVNAGFGVPRDTIKLSGGNGFDVLAGNAKVKNRHGRDVTQSLMSGCEISMQILKNSKVDAFFYMDGSPSCGVYRTTLKNSSRGKPPGLFGALLLNENFFLIPALELESPVKWWDWRRRLFAFVWLKSAIISNKSDLVDIWHQYKFICQEVDRSRADEISYLVATLPKHINSDFVEKWRIKVLLLLREPSKMPKIRSALQKHVAYYNKHAETKVNIDPNDIARGSHKLFEELLLIEKQAFLQDIEFAGAPVIFRSKNRG
ncbi:MAG: DUF523 domain-containing protein [Gammaproteobacteria bacterium]|nr:DUF523 domain-containing protein [Gammaproteobacteria bacterium]